MSLPDSTTSSTGNVDLPETPTSAQPQLYMHKDDIGMHGVVRGNTPCPAVFPLSDEQMKVTKEWQYFLVAINPGMKLHNVSGLLNNSKAYCNHHGFISDEADKSDGPRANFIKEEDLNADLPVFNKVFTHARATHTGREVTEGGKTFLIVDTLDGTNPPPMKPGKARPQKLKDIRMEDYLYNPKETPLLFFVSNNVALDGRLFPFPKGSKYSWMPNTDFYVFMPLVSDKVVKSPLEEWIKLPPGSPIPSPYQEPQNF